MKVTGFTFVKNALIYDYPVVEAIKSILPICDEFIVAVGKSDDETLDLIKSINPSKIRIVETEWDESLREGGRVLAVETNKAFAEICSDSDWAFYIQGDEVVHEKYLPIIKENMERYADDKQVDGLLFRYLHFYGSYDFVGASANWYPNEIRVIKNNKSFYSYRDAQGFRKGDNQKLKVVPIDAYIYHYGWVKDPRAMQKKRQNFNKLWHDDAWIDENIEKVETFDYEGHVRELKRFTDGHPAVMQPRIDKLNWEFDYDITQNRRSTKDQAKGILKKYLGVDTSYRNYEILKNYSKKKA